MRAQLFAAIAAIAMTGSSLSQAQSPITAPDRSGLAEQNLLDGLQSDNVGVQRSCALLLGQIRSERAVIPLMHRLRNGQTAEVRMASAWALCRIGAPEGTYLVRRVAGRDIDQRVRTRCAWYYQTLVRAGTFEFRAQNASHEPLPG